MKFTFSADRFPQLDANGLAVRCKEMGYDGIELPLARATEDTEQTRKIFTDVGVEIACISADIPMPANPSDAIKALDLAAALRAPFVKIPGPLVKRHQDRTAIGIEFAHWLAPLAQAASNRKVTLLFENAPSLRSARELWQILESLDHPSVGIAWSLVSALAAGESPFVSIPTLNSRIKYVQVTESEISDSALTVEAIVKRLLGIGYMGYITVAEDTASAEFLSAAIDQLKHWAARPESKKHHRAPAH